MLHTAPGMIELYGVGCRFDQAVWDGNQGEVISIQLPGSSVSRFMQDGKQPIDLQTRFEHVDPALANLLSTLWNQAETGSPLGPLYVEGLTLAMLGLLGTRYGTANRGSSTRTGKFGPRDVRRLIELIDDRLSEDLRIERLAAIVSMSPYHFAKMFKATFGQPPHSFILERRIDGASRALRGKPGRPLVEIATEFGFCSQAHFTEAFRRRIGTTPARWRRDAQGRVGQLVNG